MSTHHRPTNDASDEEWFAYLRGRRFHSDKEPKPVSNYVAFRGFWVPPTVLPEGSTPTEAPAPKRRAARFSASWFSDENVRKLAKLHPDAFAELKRSIAAVEAEEHAQTDKERAADYRARLDLSVEAGLMNAQAAAQRFDEWERAGRPELD